MRGLGICSILEVMVAHITAPLNTRRIRTDGSPCFASCVKTHPALNVVSTGLPRQARIQKQALLEHFAFDSRLLELFF